MKKFDDEFKREAVRLADESSIPIKETEKNLGIYEGAIREWRRELKRKGKLAFPGKGKISLSSEEEQIRKLQEENVRLKRERDILKKAVAIFSKEPNPYSGS